MLTNNEQRADDKKFIDKVCCFLLKLQLMPSIAEAVVVTGRRACSTWSRFDMIQLNSAFSAVTNISATGGMLTSQYPRHLDFFQEGVDVAAV